MYCKYDYYKRVNTLSIGQKYDFLRFIRFMRTFCRKYPKMHRKFPLHFLNRLQPSSKENPPYKGWRAFLGLEIEIN
jgi:hypothetical protein